MQIPAINKTNQITSNTNGHYTAALLYIEPVVSEWVEATLTDIKSPPICYSERKVDKALTRTTKSKFIKLLHVKFYLPERTSLAHSYQQPYHSLIATVNLLISDGRHSFGK